MASDAAARLRGEDPPQPTTYEPHLPCLGGWSFNELAEISEHLGPGTVLEPTP